MGPRTRLFGALFVGLKRRSCGPILSFRAPGVCSKGPVQNFLDLPLRFHKDFVHQHISGKPKRIPVVLVS